MVQGFWDALVSSRTPHWEELLQRLIQVPSLFEHEAAILQVVAGRIESLGAVPHRVDHSVSILERLPGAQHPFSDVTGRYGLVVRVPGQGGGRSLAFSCHLDTVPAGNPAAWARPPYSGYIDRENGLVFGRGAMDDKAGVAICLAVLECVLQAPERFQGDLLFQFVLEDEVTGNGTLLCLDAGFAAEAAIIVDGTRTDRAINEHAGQLQCDLRLTGRAVSVCVSHLGLNAAEMMSKLLMRLKEVVHGLNPGRATPWNRFPSPFQLVVQEIESRGEQLTVPDLAVARCYVTFVSPYSLADMRALIQKETATFAATNGLTESPELHWSGLACEPVKSDSSSLESVLQHVAADMEMRPIDVGPSTGTSDMRHFVESGIPCLLYGPGNGFNPHRPNEYYCLGELPTMVQYFIRVAEVWTREKAD